MADATATSTPSAPPAPAAGSAAPPPADIHAQVLIVDDEVDHAEVMAEALRKPGHICTIVHSLEQAKDELLHGTFDVIVTDLVMPGGDASSGESGAHSELATRNSALAGETAGLEVLKLAKQHQPDAETIMVTAHGDVPTAKAALQGGAYDFIEKPLDLVVFRNLVNRAAETVLLRHQNSSLRGQLSSAYGFEGIIGESLAIRRIITTIRQIAPSNIPVLIIGESGTGKELIAAAIHKHSKRASKRYVTFNAAGQSETLLEDQLFGHVRGAFTGADRDREGVFEYADGGTLFLDEIGDMPPSMQAKLLRVLETGEIVRLGSNETRKTDVRFITATNKDLKAAVASNAFREDLYFRIKGAEIIVPPLRERRDDIPRLVNHFAGKFASALQKPVPAITEPAMMRLVGYPWPGNVRELMNVIQRMVVVNEGGAPIDVRDVPSEIRSPEGADDSSIGGAGGTGTGGGGGLAGVGLDKLEKEAIRQTLGMTGGNREQAAKLLGIGERTLYRKLKEYGLR